MLLNIADVAFHGNDLQPLFPPLNALLGVRSEVAAHFTGLTDGIFTALLFLFMIFLLRVILRKEWLAAAAFIVILAMATTLGYSTRMVDFPLGMLSFGVMAFALLRFGLVAGIVATATSQILQIGGILVDHGLQQRR